MIICVRGARAYACACVYLLVCAPLAADDTLAGSNPVQFELQWQHEPPDGALEEWVIETT